MAQQRLPSKIRWFVSVVLLTLGSLSAEPAPPDIKLVDLCKMIDCSCLAPKINSVFPFSNMTPGGTVLVEGCGFGKSQGQLLLTGLKKYTGEPVPPVPLNIGDWGDTFAGGTIPENLREVKDQQVRLQVKTQNNLSRNESIPVTFSARKVIDWLPESEVKYWCSTEASEDWCNGKRENSAVFCFPTFGLPGYGSASAAHWTCDKWFEDGDDGTDEFQATLKNGWVFYDLQWVKTTCDGLCNGWCGEFCTGSWVRAPKGFKKDTTWTKLTVDWHTYHYDGLASYTITLFITGPAGVLPR